MTVPGTVASLNLNKDDSAILAGNQVDLTAGHSPVAVNYFVAAVPKIDGGTLFAVPPDALPEVHDTHCAKGKGTRTSNHYNMCIS
mgnify:CR=1 FL=1